MLAVFARKPVGHFQSNQEPKPSVTNRPPTKGPRKLSICITSSHSSHTQKHCTPTYTQGEFTCVLKRVSALLSMERTKTSFCHLRMTELAVSLLHVGRFPACCLALHSGVKNTLNHTMVCPRQNNGLRRCPPPMPEPRKRFCYRANGILQIWTLRWRDCSKLPGRAHIT